MWVSGVGASVSSRVFRRVFGVSVWLRLMWDAWYHCRIYVVALRRCFDNLVGRHKGYFFYVHAISVLFAVISCVRSRIGIIDVWDQQP